MLFFMCVWVCVRMCMCACARVACKREWCFLVALSSSTMYDTCKSAKRPVAGILKPCMCRHHCHFFYASLTEMETEANVLSEKRKGDTTSSWWPETIFLFSFLFSWMTCKGCFWVPNVCKARAMWRIIMGRIVSLFSSCTHLFHPPFFHPCTDVVAAFTQPRWTFAKYEKRLPKCFNCLFKQTKKFGVR